MTDPITNLHYTPNGNFVNGQYAPGADGFNLADASSVDQVNSLPAGDKALVWLGMTDGVTAAFKAAVSQFIGNPNVYGFYLADEPDPSTVSAANLKAESDYIHSVDPGAKTFIVLQNMGTVTNPVFNYTPANTDIDLFGLDPYPVRSQYPGGANYSIIPTAVAAAEAAGIPQADLVPVYQAFGNAPGGDWVMPTPAQEQQILSTWGSVLPHPAFDYAYSWGVQDGDTALSGDSALQQVFATHNALTDTTGGTTGSTGGTTGSTGGTTGSTGGTTGSTGGTTGSTGGTTGSTGGTTGSTGGTTDHHHHHGETSVATETTTTTAGTLVTSSSLPTVTSTDPSSTTDHHQHHTYEHMWS
jgi:hypothetical protein